MNQRQVNTLLNESTGERVTKAYIERRISDTLFTQLIEGSTVTICQLTIDNGYSVHGEAACVDPTNREHYAYEDAFKKLWPLFGFLLAEKMYQAVEGDHPHEMTDEAPAFEMMIPEVEITAAMQADQDKVQGSEGGYLSRVVLLPLKPETVVDLSDLSEDEIKGQLIADHDVEMSSLDDDCPF